MKDQKGNIGVIVSFVIVALVVVGVIYMLMNKTIKENPLDGIQTDGTMSPESTNTDSSNNAPQTQEKPSTPQKSMDQQAKNGDTLSMNYTGRLVDGTVFDSNVDPKFAHVQPFEFQLGAGQVIAGWDEGLVGMKVGEKKTLTIPPEKGYGDRAVSTIPANSTLIFDVELLAIK